MGQTAEYLKNAQEYLAMARAGLAAITSGDPTQQRPGLMNLVVFGRTVTQALQRLRSVEPTFDDWYKPRIAVVGDDPLFEFFNQLRNQILKEAELPLSNVLDIELLDSAVVRRLTANPPPGAGEFIIGDELGGTGWVVRLPDGTRTMFYIQVPSDVGIHTSLELAGAPTVHAGSPIPDSSIETLGRLYVEALSSLVDEAVERFG